MLASRVLPGAALVRASFVRVNAFKSVDLPTFERPANAIWASPSAGILSARPPAAALVTKSAPKIFTYRDPGSGIRDRLLYGPSIPYHAPRQASVSNRVVRDRRLNVGPRRGWRHRGQRAGER